MKKKRNLTLIIGAVLTAFMLLFLLIGFFYTPYDPDAMNGAAKFAAPSLSHPFGCDHFGRDIFSRVLKEPVQPSSSLSLLCCSAEPLVFLSVRSPGILADGLTKS